MPEIRTEKNKLRDFYRQRRRALCADEKATAEKKLCESFLKSASYKYYDTILLYCATPEETDITDIARCALADGKRVAYPRCHAKERKMTFHYITSLDELSPSVLGIKAPPANAPVFDRSAVSCGVCLIPAIVFDRRGYRVGYGGGYYDRFLSCYKGTKLGVVLSDFIIPEVPAGKYDVRADVLLTEGGTISVAKA